MPPVSAYELTYLSVSPQCRKSPNEALGAAIFHLYQFAGLYLALRGIGTLHLTRLSGKTLNLLKVKNSLDQINLQKSVTVP